MFGVVGKSGKVAVEIGAEAGESDFSSLCVTHRQPKRIIKVCMENADW